MNISVCYRRLITNWFDNYSYFILILVGWFLFAGIFKENSLQIHPRKRCLSFSEEILIVSLQDGLPHHRLMLVDIEFVLKIFTSVGLYFDCYLREHAKSSICKKVTYCG